MRIKPIYFCFFSLLPFLSFAQDTPDSVRWKYQPNFMVGVDVLNAGISFFSDRKLYQGFVSSRIRKKLLATADAGYEKNIYRKNGYDAEAKGPFVKLGAAYVIVEDPENTENGFYLGGKLAGSFYRQQYDAVPVRGYAGSNSSVSFPARNESSYWIEGSLGGRVELFHSNFFIDMNVQPRYLIASTKQEELQPMIVPGFGKSSTKFGIGFMWNIAYLF